MPTVPIKGIANLGVGVFLSDDAYKLGTIPEGFTEFHTDIVPTWIDDPESGLQAKFLQKDQTVYVLVAGTNNFKEDYRNCLSKGKSQFDALEPALKDVIIKANNNGSNVVIVGDSGGGFVAQHAHLKYGIDAFCTNTSGVWPLDAEIDIASQDPFFYYNPYGKMITVINDGEVLSTSLGYPSYGEVFVIPSNTGALYRYNKDELGQNPILDGALTAEQGVAAHKDRQYMFNYLDQGGKVYSGGLSYYAYVGNHPELLPPESYSDTPDIKREVDPDNGTDFLYGYFGRNMLREEFAASLNVPVDQVERARGGYFAVDLANYPSANIQEAIRWFDFKKMLLLQSNKYAGVGGADRFAVGGHLESGQVSGPGTGTSDSILAWLGNKGKFIRISNGEYVIRADAVQKWGTNFLDNINNGHIPQNFYNGKSSYATGGSISDNLVKNPQGNLGETLRNLALTIIQSIQKNYVQELVKQIMSGLGLDVTASKPPVPGTLSNGSIVLGSAPSGYIGSSQVKQKADGSLNAQKGLSTSQQPADYNLELGKTKSLLDQIHEASKKAFEDGLVNYLTKGIMQSKSLGDALRNLANSVLQSIQKVYAEAMTKNIMSMLNLGAPSSSSKSVLGTTASNGFYYDPNFYIKKIGAAEGGHIQGPGTGTSDSILAQLSNGEFVIKASSVQKYGTNFLHSLNNGFVPNNLMPRFATGGLVGASVEGASAIAGSIQSGDVTVPLKVVNVTDPNEVGRYLKTRSGERIMVNFMKNNAGTMRQILNVKG
jgi:hypothetical protein